MRKILWIEVIIVGFEAQTAIGVLDCWGRPWSSGLLIYFRHLGIFTGCSCTLHSPLAWTKILLILFAKFDAVQMQTTAELLWEENKKFSQFVKRMICKNVNNSITELFGRIFNTLYLLYMQKYLDPYLTLLFSSHNRYFCIIHKCSLMHNCSANG